MQKVLAMTKVVQKESTSFTNEEKPKERTLKKKERIVIIEYFRATSMVIIVPNIIPISTNNAMNVVKGLILLKRN